MTLSQMQDIGGLRAVVATVSKVRRLERSYDDSWFQHELSKKNDYINEPKTSGYRGLHLVYKYRNRNRPEYNDLKIELQLRSKLQHNWAMAVETAGLFFDKAMKSSEGPADWLRFFSAISSAFACIEACPRVPGFDEGPKRKLFRYVKAEAERLNVEAHLRGFATALEIVGESQRRGAFVLIVLDLEKKVLQFRPFLEGALDAATEAYGEVENKIRNGASLNAVLVRTSSMDELRRAYPSYFADTQGFLRGLKSVVDRTR